ncbi:hypothetical protein ACSBR1_038641 [Camellia fascicularis]
MANMIFFNTLTTTISNFLLIALLFTYTLTTTINIQNLCPYTVWAAAIPGGGRRLDYGQAWEINPPPGTTQARTWGRTNCTFDESGQGKCQTGDCNGLLQCQSYGAPPNTLAEYTLNQFNNLDIFDISLVDGFNMPMEFSPISEGCTRGIKCIADINRECPIELQTVAESEN